jgi:hypothetical protein
VNPLTCQAAEHATSDQLAGLLSDDERGALEYHLAGSDSCSCLSWTSCAARSPQSGHARDGGSCLDFADHGERPSNLSVRTGRRGSKSARRSKVCRPNCNTTGWVTRTARCRPGYTHITAGMRRALLEGLTGLWESALDERRAMAARSPVAVLDRLLVARAKEVGE